jgi:hypothetical protein
MVVLPLIDAVGSELTTTVVVLDAEQLFASVAVTE